MSSRAVVGSAIVAALVVLVGVVVTRGADDPAAPPRQAARTPAPTLADLASAGPLAVAREPFCDRVDGTAVAAALGGEPAGQEAYENGDRVTLAPGVDDVAHEDGCSWTGPDGTLARAWVFTPPVTPARARRLGRQVGSAAGCTPYDSTGFGDPTTAWICTGAGTAAAGHAGLFGDAWLSCVISAPVPPGGDPSTLRTRADAWCAAVGYAVAAS